MVCPATDNYASCKIQAIIHFLQAEIMNAVEIHHEVCMQQSRMLEDGQKRLFMIKSEVVSQL
jgi:hypothetical protein